MDYYFSGYSSAKVGAHINWGFILSTSKLMYLQKVVLTSSFLQNLNLRTLKKILQKNDGLKYNHNVMISLGMILIVQGRNVCSFENRTMIGQWLVSVEHWKWESFGN